MYLCNHALHVCTYAPMHLCTCVSAHVVMNVLSDDGASSALMLCK